MEHQSQHRGPCPGAPYGECLIAKEYLRFQSRGRQLYRDFPSQTTHGSLSSFGRAQVQQGRRGVLLGDQIERTWTLDVTAAELLFPGPGRYVCRRNLLGLDRQ